MLHGAFLGPRKNCGVLCRSGLSPEFLKLAKAGHLEAWNLPLGMSKLLPFFCAIFIAAFSPAIHAMLWCSLLVMTARTKKQARPRC